MIKRYFHKSSIFTVSCTLRKLRSSDIYKQHMLLINNYPAKSRGISPDT